ncbi:MAG: hypothetical protein HWE33_12960 [Rhodobacteraceae bacterium]|nr:hypothetical protein [Paracoccaceae bacterium]
MADNDKPAVDIEAWQRWREDRFRTGLENWRDSMEPYLEAERGDLRRVIDMLERGEKLPVSVRKIMADHLRGEGRPSRRSRQQERTEFEDCCVVAAHMERGLSKFKAIQAAALDLGKPEETIKTYLRNLKRDYSK